MPLKYVKASLPHLNLLTKILLILAIMGMSAFGAFAFRMSKGPLDLDFIKPRVEAALSNSNYQVKIGKAALIWPKMTDSILFDLSNVEIIQNNITALNIDNIDVGLSRLNLLRGKILPSKVIIEGPTFYLAHEDDGEINFFWQEQGKSQNSNEKNSEEIKTETSSPREVHSNVRSILEKITEENDSHNILSAIKRIELKKAVVKTQQSKTSNGEYVALVDLLLEKNNFGLEGNLQVFLPSEEGKTANLKSDILYRRKQKDIIFTADVRDLNPSSFQSILLEYPDFTRQNIVINGAVKAAFDDRLRLQMASLNLNLPKGELNFPDIYDQPVVTENISLDIDLNRLKKTFDLKTLEATIEGIKIRGSASGVFEKGNLKLPLKLEVANLPLEKVPAIFPKTEADTSAGEWATKKLQNGRIYDVVITTDLTIMRDNETKTRSIATEKTKATFNVEGVTVKYSDTLMPVKNATGSGVYEDDTLVINGKKGTVGEVQGRNLKLKMTNISVEGGGLADINFDASGPLKSALEFVSDEPISVGDDLGFDIKGVKGQLDYNVQLNFPTVKDLPKEEVKVVVKGVATDILLPKVVKGQDLTGGPFALEFQDGAITLKGKGQLAGRPLDLDWLQYLDSTGRDYESKIVAKITADRGLRDIFGIGLEDYISGPMPVNVTYIDRGVKATIDVVGDATPTTLHIEPFDYTKEAGVKGDLSLKVFMNKEDIEEIDNLKINTQDFSLTNGRLIFRKLKDGSSDVERGNFPSVTLGKTNAVIEFEITPNDVLKATANGSVIDLSPFISRDRGSQKKISQPKEPERAMQISASAPRMIGEDGVILGNAKIYLESDTGGEITRIETDAKIGKGNMYLRFKPDVETGKRTFRLESSDAGATLKAFGLYDEAVGGSLLVYGEPQKGDNKGDLYGTAVIENFRVKGAPALAKLLGAMSLKGAQDLLKNDGVSFTKLESKFEWRFKEGGNLLVMKEGRTSGSSLGLTFEGIMNQQSDTVDVSGTIIPVSGVNNVISDIPVIGNILTGGDALIAATYSMKGVSNDPKVSVNPLSVLAPGFLRKIFFEGDIDSKAKREEKKMEQNVAPKVLNDNNAPATNTQQVQQPVVIAPNINTN